MLTEWCGPPAKRWTKKYFHWAVGKRSTMLHLSIINGCRKRRGACVEEKSVQGLFLILPYLFVKVMARWSTGPIVPWRLLLLREYDNALEGKIMTLVQLDSIYQNDGCQGEMNFCTLYLKKTAVKTGQCWTAGMIIRYWQPKNRPIRWTCNWSPDNGHFASA